MLIKRKTLQILSTVIILIFTSVLVYSFSAGIAGRTPKTSATPGCGGCHGSSATPTVLLNWIAPDSVAAGQTVVMSLVINSATHTGAGFDIAAKNGTLDTAMPLTKVLNGEIVQTANIPMIAGTSAIVFRYTAPTTPGTDTLFGVGLATNSNGGSTGDAWNIAIKKPIRIVTPIGIEENSAATQFRLDQNFPNPFNPSTTINFELYKPGNVRIVVYDILGNEVATLINGYMREGSHSVKWNINDSKDKASSGIYFYKLLTNGTEDIKKMILTK
jgi:hypothetical protein